MNGCSPRDAVSPYMYVRAAAQPRPCSALTRPPSLQPSLANTCSLHILRMRVRVLLGTVTPSRHDSRALAPSIGNLAPTRCTQIQKPSDLLLLSSAALAHRPPAVQPSSLQSTQPAATVPQHSRSLYEPTYILVRHRRTTPHTAPPIDHGQPSRRHDSPVSRLPSAIHLPQLGCSVPSVTRTAL